MRAKELFEGYNQKLDSAVNNLLVGARGNGALSINTQQLASKLQAMGFSVDPNSLASLLQNNPSVTSVTPQSITLVGGENTEGGATQGEDSASRVGDMAQAATKIG